MFYLLKHAYGVKVIVKEIAPEWYAFCGEKGIFSRVMLLRLGYVIEKQLDMNSL